MLHLFLFTNLIYNCKVAQAKWFSPVVCVTFKNTSSKAEKCQQCVEDVSLTRLRDTPVFNDEFFVIYILFNVLKEWDYLFQNVGFDSINK